MKTQLHKVMVVLMPVCSVIFGAWACGGSDTECAADASACASGANGGTGSGGGNGSGATGGGGSTASGGMGGAGGSSGVSCVTDSFDGTALDAHWVTGAGTITTYNVGTGKFTVTDGGFADTPSTSPPNDSWIYNLATDGNTFADKGNSIRWDQDLSSDFEVSITFDWDNSAGPDLLQWGTLALVDASNSILAYAGYADSSSSVTGTLRAQIWDGAIENTFAAGASTGEATMVMKRTGNALSIVYGGQTVASDAAFFANHTATAVAIVTVRHRTGAMEYPYGAFEVSEVKVCK